MVVKSIKIGNIQLDNNIFLAPMAGFTDSAFREAVKDLSYGLMFTELVSSKGLFFGAKNNNVILDTNGDYSHTAVQIFGSDSYYMRLACESEYLKPFSIVDINMGCPVPKVYKNGDGSALLCDIKKAEQIVLECVKSGKIITAKIRTGLKEGDDIASEYCKMLEGAGVKLVTIHGRVRENYYSGTPDFKAIERAKKSVSIPIIANGGIFTPHDADIMIDRTGADGVMVARGAIANPFFPLTVMGKENPISLKEFIINFLNLSAKLKGEKRASVEFRKFLPYFLKGQKNVKDLKMRILQSCDIDYIKKEIIENL